MLEWYKLEIRGAVVNVKFRGTLRKWSIEQQIDLQVENAENNEGCDVRVYVLSLEDREIVGDWIVNNFNATVTVVGETTVKNPVCAKDKCNISTRY